MAFLWGRNKPKLDLVRPAKDLLERLRQPPKLQKTEEEISKLLAQIKLVLTGTQETDSNPDAVFHLINSMIEQDFLYVLAYSIHLLSFESRKDSQAIFSYVLRFRPPGSTAEDSIALSYVINKRPDVVTELCRGYNYKESAMPCGAVLREILKHELIVSIILYDEPLKNRPDRKISDIANLDEPQSGDGVFWKFFDWIDGGAFEVSADAFTTFRDILTKHKPQVSQYLMTNFDLFFKRYNTILIESSSYVTKRQSIKLLGEILLDRANYNVMTAYVDRGDHLKLCMNLLRDERKMVQYEGFHVFKVFVANPHKSDAVKRILTQNRERLLKFLPGFLADRTEDEQFTDEKSFLIRQIETLPPPA
ncbi:Mo25-like protein [Usnea florida]